MFTDNMINLFGLLNIPKTATLASLDTEMENDIFGWRGGNLNYSEKKKN
jgi:hypothetical protein